MEGTKKTFPLTFDPRLCAANQRPGVFGVRGTTYHSSPALCVSPSLPPSLPPHLQYVFYTNELKHQGTQWAQAGCLIQTGPGVGPDVRGQPMQALLTRVA